MKHPYAVGSSDRWAERSRPPELRARCRSYSSLRAALAAARRLAERTRWPATVTWLETPVRGTYLCTPLRWTLTVYPAEVLRP